ncbi:MAG: hypothetical protein HKO59_03125 [Phycisphaerales bacterium]|nr:zf-HC2 domain-containing protein [Phycisphaerae bacterium]NNF43393.1 hypothetical protein [Phycisphaerales bacterium]NNM24974.1 hypothetical protein [Phycisphaerales bacterium]
MDPSREQLAALVRQLAVTAPEELDCETVLRHVAAYLEATHADAPVAPELAMIRQHLDVCPSCLEEFEALTRAVESD